MGWVPYHVPFSELAEAYETVTDAATDSGRQPEHLVVKSFVPAAVSEDPDRARAIIKENLAGYIGKFTDDSYRNIVHKTYPKETDRISNRWQVENEGGGIKAVSEEMVADFCVAGTSE